jgi:solute:Na+ symporter, SSS family
MTRFSLICVLALSAVTTFGQSDITISKWKDLPPLPDPEGFAGAYAGVSHGALLVAGGANFPGNTGPWGSSPKIWYDDVYVLEHGKAIWKQAGKLPQAMGYGVSITTQDGIFCLGGADKQTHYDQTFFLNWQKGKVNLVKLPSLPVPIAYAAGVLLNGKVYVAGGTTAPTDTIAQKRFWAFDLQNHLWEELPPWPGPGRMLSVAGAQDGKFFLFSGVSLAKNKDTMGVTRTYLRESWVFTPSSKTWKRLADLPHAVAAAPSPAYSTGKSYLAIVGGDDGANAHRVLELKEKHPGFRKEIVAYNTITDTWTKIGIVSDSPAAVTTPAVIWDAQLVIPSGEISPGIRSPKIRAVSVSINQGKLKRKHSRKK